MPERAAELRAIFEQGFEEPIVKKIWPHMAYSAAIGTASFEPYQKKLKRYLGDLPHYFFGIGASEGFFTVPFEMNNPNGVFVPHISFYEFIPEEANGDASKALTLDQIEEGKEYELVITNLSGFYRYRMRDIVRITGMHNNTPTAQFIRCIDKTISVIKVKRGLCAPTEVRYLQPETYLLYHEVMFMRGANRSQIKTVNVIGNVFQRKFFRGLSSELYADSL